MQQRERQVMARVCRGWFRGRAEPQGREQGIGQVLAVWYVGKGPHLHLLDAATGHRAAVCFSELHHPHRGGRVRGSGLASISSTEPPVPDGSWNILATCRLLKLLLRTLCSTSDVLMQGT